MAAALLATSVSWIHSHIGARLRTSALVEVSIVLNLNLFKMGQCMVLYHRWSRGGTLLEKEAAQWRIESDDKGTQTKSYHLSAATIGFFLQILISYNQGKNIMLLNLPIWGQLLYSLSREMYVCWYSEFLNLRLNSLLRRRVWWMGFQILENRLQKEKGSHPHHAFHNFCSVVYTCSRKPSRETYLVFLSMGSPVRVS